MKARTVSIWPAPRVSDIPRWGQRNGDVRKTSALGGIACSGGRPDLLARHVRAPRRRAQRGEDVAARRGACRGATGRRASGESAAWFETSWIGRSLTTPAASVSVANEGKARRSVSVRTRGRTVA